MTTETPAAHIINNLPRLPEVETINHLGGAMLVALDHDGQVAAWTLSHASRHIEAMSYGYGEPLAGLYASVRGSLVPARIETVPGSQHAHDDWIDASHAIIAAVPNTDPAGGGANGTQEMIVGEFSTRIDGRA